MPAHSGIICITDMGGIEVNVGKGTKRILELAIPPVALSPSQADQLQKIINYGKSMNVAVVVRIVK